MIIRNDARMRIAKPRGVLGALVFLLFSMYCATQASARGNDIFVEFGGLAFDMEMDEGRRVLYVSVPSRSDIAVVSTDSWTIVRRVPLPGSPRGIDLGRDGQHLYAALDLLGAVAVVDLDDDTVTTIDVLERLDNSRTFDVAVGRPGRLYVTASPGSGGFAYVVQVDLDGEGGATRVASNRIIRAAPTIERSPDDLSLYISEGFSPNSLYKLDLGSESAPIVLEDDHGSVSGTRRLGVSPDGSRIALGSGQILRTGSFVEAARVDFGVRESRSMTNGSR